MPRKRKHPIDLAQEFLQSGGARAHRTILRSFCRWMGKRRLGLSNLKPHHVEQFWQYERGRGIRESTIASYRLGLHKWLYWLAGCGELSFDVTPPVLRHLFEPLPDVARRFLGGDPPWTLEKRVRYFHSWLRKQKLDLEQLEPEHIDDFLWRPRNIEIVRSARDILFKQLEPYFLWLHDSGFFTFRFQRLSPKEDGLDEHARAFLESLAAVKKESTCKAYCSSLLGFYLWLHDEKIALHSLERRDTTRWLKLLVDRGISRGTRKNRIIHLRLYFEWLFENRLIDAHPDDLIRPTDIPKTPQYLPRPYHPDFDRELIRRLANDPSVHSQALLLMRRTGIRIGELVRLDPHCLVKDTRGYFFLKVPLGKLDNERLVPLDTQARMVLENLLNRRMANDPYLLEPLQKRYRVMKDLRNQLKSIAHGIDANGPIVTHRLRHTYATELLNAGMSLAAIMKLLGHKSISMTARYAELTLHSVIDQYRSAMMNIANKYEPPIPSPQNQNEHLHPSRLLLDSISWLKLNRENLSAHQSKIDALIKRIYRIENEISALKPLV